MTESINSEESLEKKAHDEDIKESLSKSLDQASDFNAEIPDQPLETEVLDSNLEVSTEQELPQISSLTDEISQENSTVEHVPLGNEAIEEQNETDIELESEADNLSENILFSEAVEPSLNPPPEDLNSTPFYSTDEEGDEPVNLENDDDLVDPENFKEKHDTIQVNVKASTANFWNQLSPISEEINIELKPLEPDKWQKIREVFVKTKGYSKQVKAGWKNRERIFIVSGDDNTGKYANAIDLGLQLYETKRPNLIPYKPEPRERLSLRVFIQNQKLREQSSGTVYILKNAFQYNLHVEDLKDEISFVSGVLFDLESFLILTTTLNTEHFEDLSIPVIQTNIPQDTRAVLENHLAYYSKPGTLLHHLSDELVERVRKSSNDILELLKSPIQINRFCTRLSREIKIWGNEQKIEDKILKLAEKISRIGYEDTKTWFKESLNPNEQLYAMLATLFDKLDYIQLNKIYIASVRHLREQGLSDYLVDPRRIGLQELLEKIHATVDDENILAFDHNVFKNEVNEQLKNYQHLLWTLVEPFQELIEELRAPNQWQARVIIGHAIGRIGIYDLERLNPVLNKLARNEHGGIVAVTGNILDEIFRSGQEHYKFALDILQGWINSGHANLMWAVAAAIWRFYDELAALVKSNDELTSKKAADAIHSVHMAFTDLAKNHNRFSKEYFGEIVVNLQKPDSSGTQSSIRLGDLRRYLSQKSNDISSAIIFAVSKIFENHPGKITKLLEEWIRDEDEANLMVLGLIAIQQLFEKCAREKIMLTNERIKPLLNTLTQFIRTSSKIKDGSILIALVFDAIYKWIKQDYDQLYFDIHSSLLYTANRLSANERAVFRDIIFDRWLSSKDIVIRQMAGSLFSRTLLLDGALVAPNNVGIGLLVMDLSKAALRNNSSFLANTRLFYQLNPLLHVEVQGLGTLQQTGTPYKADVQEQIPSDHFPPRILTPSLEEHETDTCWIILINVWGNIVDFEDAWNSGEHNKFLILSGYSQEWPNGADVIRVKPQWWQSTSRIEFRLFNNALYAKLAERILQIPLEQWPNAEHDNLKEEIIKYAYQIDDVSLSDEEHDLVRKLNQLVIRKLSESPSDLVAWVLDWLESDEELAIIGLSCCKLVFTLYQRIIPLPLENFSCLLKLLPRLAVNPDIDGFDLALRAIRYWIRNSDWLDLIQEPNGAEEPLLVQALRSCKTVSSERIFKLLEYWARPINELDETEDDLDDIKAYVELLVLRLKVGADRTRPQLPRSEMKFGIVLVNGSESRLRNIKLLREVHEFIGLATQEKTFEDVYLIVYRLGSQNPIFFDGEEVTIDQLVGYGLPSLPSLAGPILDLYDLDQVQFVLFCTHQSISDAEDWCKHWQAKSFLFTNYSGSKPIQCLNNPPLNQIVNDDHRVAKHVHKRLLFQTGD